MAKQPAKAAFDLDGYRSAPSIGRPNMRIMLRTGGPRAPGLTLAPSAKVFQSPDMTAWAVFFKVQKMEDTCPFTNHLFSGFFTTIFGPLFKNFLDFFKAERLLYRSLSAFDMDGCSEALNRGRYQMVCSQWLNAYWIFLRRI